MLGDGLYESSALTAAASGRQRARRLESMKWDFRAASIAEQHVLYTYLFVVIQASSSRFLGFHAYRKNVKMRLAGR